MTIVEKIKPGDFTTLADNYSKYRPSYTETVLSAILDVVNKPNYKIDFVDVGAGTGIWTRLVAARNCHSVTAIEPNVAMRQEGKAMNGTLTVNWIAGSAEDTHLPDNSADLLTMASSFHWADFDKATHEFHRVLKPNGYFVILWNPRYLENSPMLLEIEAYIPYLQPNINRVSSGKSAHVDALAKRLENCPLFTDMLYLEGKHRVTLTKEQYLGAWQSVNDIRTQLGEEKFRRFLNYVQEKIQSTSVIECTYQTRAWVVKKQD